MLATGLVLVTSTTLVTSNEQATKLCICRSEEEDLLEAEDIRDAAQTALNASTLAFINCTTNGGNRTVEEDAMLFAEDVRDAAQTALEYAQYAFDACMYGGGGGGGGQASLSVSSDSAIGTTKIENGMQSVLVRK
jgi:hypothetical protein